MGPRSASTTRWIRLGIVATLLFASLLAAHPALSQEHPPGHGHGGDEMLPPGAWTDAEKAALHDLIADTEAELPAFADIPSLASKGFKDFGATTDGYIHYINVGYIEDDHVLDPRYPESLVFHQDWDTGDIALVSAMFILQPEVAMEDIPDDIAWIPGWHAHPEVCINDDYTFAGLTNPPNPCTNGRAWDKPPMIHVWIVDNECEHRFGGIDLSGLHCHVDGQPGGMPTTTTTSTTTTTTSTTAPPATSTTQPPNQLRPATPVSGNPQFTG